jgi:Leucine Rich repeat
MVIGGRLTGMTESVIAIPDPAADKPPLRRRRSPLSWRLFIGMALAAPIGGTLWGGIWVWYSLRAFRQIEGLGGRVKTEQGFRGVARAFDNVTEVDLSGTEAGEASLSLLGSLPMPIQSLDLGDTPTTDRALTKCDCQPYLQRLMLRNCKITDVGMASIQKQRRLRVLDLDGTAVTDTGLAPLQGHPALERIALNQTAITDAGLAVLGTITTLECIGLTGTHVTDAGLKHLARLKDLRDISLVGTAVTEQGILELQRSFPGLHIAW